MNGWTILPVFRWFIAKKKNKEPIWFHQSELPKYGDRTNRKRFLIHLHRFLNGKLPR